MNTEELSLLFLELASLASIPILYWIFKDPSKSLKRNRSVVLLAAIIIIYIGFAFFSFVLGKRFFSSLFVAYPLLYAVVFRKQIRSTRLFSINYGLFVIPFILLWFGELFAVLDYSGPILRHFIFYTGYYIGYALVILFFFRRWSFSFAQVLTIGGLFGVLIEQEFMLPKLFIQGISGNFEAFIFFLISAPFIFLVHGLYLAGPFLLFYEEIKINPNANKRHVFLLCLALLFVPLLSWGIWSFVLTAFNINLIGII